MKFSLTIVLAFTAISVAALPDMNALKQPRMEAIARQTRLPHIAVIKATIREMIGWVRHRTAELPPLRKELNIAYIGRVEPEKLITLDFHDVPLLEVLQAAAHQADLQIKFTDDAIYLFPKNEKPSF